MGIKTGTALITVALALASLPAVAQDQGRDRARIDRDQQVDRDRDFDRDRMQDRDRSDVPSRDRDRDRIQDRTHAPDFAKLSDDEIYGSTLMTQRERNEYRKNLQNTDSAEAREQLRAEHQAQMQERAQQRGVDLKPTSEGPIYGAALLSVQERNQYREQLRETDSDERGEFIAQHREQMQARAKARGVPFEDLDES